jgi:hypothetical protein
MQIEPVGAALIVILLFLGILKRAPFTVALFASLPFGATAVATLPALGGASLMLFTPLAGLLTLSALPRRTATQELRAVFASHWAPAVIAVLVLYVVAGSIILPRLFAGEISVFVPSMGRIAEVPLMPVSGNITQSCYFAADALLFFAVAMLLLRPTYFGVLKVAMFCFATVHVGLCLVDLAGKAATGGDILSFLRTAGYSMLTEVQAEGFWRIVGGYPEASISAAATATALAFTFSYWRSTGHGGALALTIILSLLLILSTSTTGYVVALALAIGFLADVLRCAGQGRLRVRDVWVLAMVVAGVAAMLALAVADENALGPLTRLLQGSLFEKASSSSAAERLYWNYKSLMAFVDTSGLGIGLGSSRASSLVVAVLSQLGLFGALALAALSWEILKPLAREFPPHLIEVGATCRGLRAAGFASLVSELVSGGNADPGLLFFIAIAALIAARKLALEPVQRSTSRDLLWGSAAEAAPAH